jgi:hypothetical protein
MKAQNARTSRRTAAMKKIGIAFAVLAMILLRCDGANAQKLAPKPAPVTIAPDLTKLNIEKAAAGAAGEGKRARPWQVWTLAGAAAVVVVVLMIGVTLRQRTARMIPGDQLAAAQKPAEWRAPSNGLLATPGQEILRTMPRLGESYLNVPVKTDEEE